MVEPIAVFSLLIAPCLAYVAGALLFWVVGLCWKQSDHEFEGGQSS